MGLIEDTALHLQELDRRIVALRESVSRRRAACAREHAAMAKRKGSDGEKTRWLPPVYAPWLAGETPHDTGPGGAAGGNRRAGPGADENPAPRGPSS